MFNTQSQSPLLAVAGLLLLIGSPGLAEEGDTPATAIAILSPQRSIVLATSPFTVSLPDGEYIVRIWQRSADGEVIAYDNVVRIIADVKAPTVNAVDPTPPETTVETPNAADALQDAVEAPKLKRGGPPKRVPLSQTLDGVSVSMTIPADPTFSCPICESWKVNYLAWFKQRGLEVEEIKVFEQNVPTFYVKFEERPNHAFVHDGAMTLTDFRGYYEQVRGNVRSSVVNK